MLLLLLAAPPQAQTPPATPLTLVSREGRRPIASSLVNGREVVSLDEVAALFPVAIKEDAAAGGVILTYRGRSIVFSANQSIASVDGRVVSLPSPVQRVDDRWLVPVEFLQIALGPIYDQRIQVRRASRLVIVGTVRVPRVEARIAAGPPTRVTADITPAATVSATQDGPRVLIRIDADALDLSLPPAGSGLVQQIRPGEQPNTLVLTLDPAAGPVQAVATAAATGTRLTIDIPEASVSAAPPGPAAAPLPADPLPAGDDAVDRDDLLAPRPVLQTIVLDPGHGGLDSGVEGTSGTDEKTVAMNVAQRLRLLLETRLGVRVLLTRDGDTDVGLDRRAAIANNAKADLFLSLHVNGAPARSVAGAEVYYLQLDREGEEARQQAAAAAVVMPVIGGGTRTLEILRWDLAQARHVERSGRLAAIIAEHLAAHVPMSRSPIRRAPLRVLEGVNMPAALVEMAYLTNPDQEELAASEEYADDVAQALFDGVVRFRRHLEEQQQR